MRFAFESAMHFRTRSDAIARYTPCGCQLVQEGAGKGRKGGEFAQVMQLRNIVRVKCEEGGTPGLTSILLEIVCKILHMATTRLE